MNALATLVELVEVAALIVLVVYLIRITRDKDDTEPKSAIIDRNLAELAGFTRTLAGNPDLVRIWQDGRADRRLNDIDQERFSLLAADYLTLLANQQQRAGSIQDAALAEAGTLKLIDTLLLNPGLQPEWEEIADKVASPALKEAVAKALNPLPAAEETAPETTPESSEAASEASEESQEQVEEEVSAPVTAAATETPEPPEAAQAVSVPDTEEPAASSPEPAAGPAPVTGVQPAAAAEIAKAPSASRTETATAERTDSEQLDAIPAKAS